MCLLCLFEGNYCFEQRQGTFKQLVLERFGLCVFDLKRRRCAGLCGRKGQTFGLLCNEITLMCCLVFDTCLCCVSDVDECQRDADVCPPRQTCKNTFGSFVCVCQDGFVMGRLQGSVQCRGVVFSCYQKVMMFFLHHLNIQ